MKYILTTAQLNTMGQCWVAQLAWYNFTVLYKLGITNIEADALSMIDWKRELTTEAVTVILDNAMDGCSPLAKICAHTMAVIPSFLVTSGNARSDTRQVAP